MNVSVKVKAGSKIDSVEKIDDRNLVVKTKAPPVDGKANDAVRRLLADYYGVKLSDVSLKRGQTHSEKIFEILLG